MVLHLERGTCASRADCDLVEEAARSSQNLADYRSQYSNFPFECASCDDYFRFVSGLLQHVESDKCEESLGCSGLLDCFLDELEENIVEGH